MKNVLQINSSILAEHSVSIQLSNYFTETLLNTKEFNLTTRDVVDIPHFDGQALMAFSGQGSNISEKHKKVLDLSDKLIEEISNSDVIVLGAPMYNFGIPSQLKSFFDLICRVGVTFKYTEKGPVGLLKDKPVYIVSPRGGIYHSIGQDFITPYLKQVCQFVGLNNLHFIYAEELNMENGVNKDAIIETTKSKIDSIIEGILSYQVTAA